MSLSFTDEQESFQQALQSFLGEAVTSEYLRARSPHFVKDDALWARVREMGLFSFFAEEGIEAGQSRFRELAIIAFESGRGLFPGELSDSILAGPVLLSSYISKKYKSELEKVFQVKDIVSGSIRILPVIRPEIELDIEKNGGALRVSGSLPPLAGTENVDAFALLASRGGRRSPQLILVPISKGHVEVTRSAGLDLTMSIAQVKLTKAPALDLGVNLVGQNRLLLSLMALKSAELAGIAFRVVQMTTEFVKTRKQFGVPVGSFQAVQHKLADMHLQAEAVRALSNFAGWAADSSPDQFELSARSAIYYACDSVPGIIESAIQLHGGIGFTWEHDLHLYLRRARKIETIWRPSIDDCVTMLLSTRPEATI